MMQKSKSADYCSNRPFATLLIYFFFFTSKLISFAVNGSSSSSSGGSSVNCRDWKSGDRFIKEQF